MSLKAKLIALANGTPLVDSEGTQLSLSIITLISHIGTFEQFTPEELEDLEIYVNPLQSKVDMLEAQITELNKQLTENKLVGRATYKHLSVAEVREIEEILIKDMSTDIDLIVSTYDTSFAVVKRIREGKHTKSSTKYIGATHGHY